MQDPDFRATTFPSELGWMAALVRGKSLSRLVFGHRSPQQAVAALWKPTARPVQSVQVPPDLQDCLHSDRIAEGPGSPAWIARLQAYARGEDVDLRKIQLDLGPVTPFQQRVLDLCRQIPYGQTLTYGQLAAAAGVPRGARAVGNAMATNCIPLVIPCHRVVPAGGQLGGYSAVGGVRMKLRLLEAEAAGAARFRAAKPRVAAV